VTDASQQRMDAEFEETCAALDAILAGPGSMPFPTCLRCGKSWHGLRQGSCEGSHIPL
jgi:hypothetical protein